MYRAQTDSCLLPLMVKQAVCCVRILIDPVCHKRVYLSRHKSVCLSSPVFKSDIGFLSPSYFPEEMSSARYAESGLALSDESCVTLTFAPVFSPCRQAGHKTHIRYGSSSHLTLGNEHTGTTALLVSNMCTRAYGRFDIYFSRMVSCVYKALLTLHPKRILFFGQVHCPLELGQ